MNELFKFPIPEMMLQTVLPVIVVALTGLVALIVEMLAPKRDNALLVAVSLGGLVLSGFLLFQQLSPMEYTTGADMILHDSLSGGLQVVILLGAGITILFSDPYLRQKGIPFGEFYALLMWATSGAMLMTETNNLMMVFIGLEILSIALYVMAGMGREERKSEESAMKYFLLGAFASGFLLYGIAMFYGATGSLSLSMTMTAWHDNAHDARPLLAVSVGLMMIGLSFKAGFVPFHQWTPDVYQGAPTNVTAFMATVTKVAAFAVIWRVLNAASMLDHLWVPAVSTIAVLTMLLGNMLALAQKDVKRILAYSSISHAGYVLVAVIAHAVDPGGTSVSTICYYLLSYTLMTGGSFALIALLAKNGKEPTDCDDLKGLWKRSPAAAALLIYFMFSLIGLPPLSGFFGKALIFADALNAGLVPLAVILAISSVISVGYYLRIALAVFKPGNDGGESQTSAFSGMTAVAATLCAVGVLAITVFYTPIVNSLQVGPPSAGPVAMVERSAK